MQPLFPQKNLPFPFQPATTLPASTMFPTKTKFPTSKLLLFRTNSTSSQETTPCYLSLSFSPMQPGHQSHPVHEEQTFAKRNRGGGPNAQLNSSSTPSIIPETLRRDPRPTRMSRMQIARLSSGPSSFLCRPDQPPTPGHGLRENLGSICMPRII